MRLESGPAKTDAMWHLGRAVLFLAFTAWFVYDGAVGWPSKNQEEATSKLAAPQPFGGAVKWSDLGEKPTQTSYERLQHKQPKARGEVTEALGEATYAAGNDAYYISHYGYAKVTYAGERVSAMTSWVPWYKGKEEIQQQFLWGRAASAPRPVVPVEAAEVDVAQGDHRRRRHDLRRPADRVRRHGRVT